MCMSLTVININATRLNFCGVISVAYLVGVADDALLGSVAAVMGSIRPSGEKKISIYMYQRILIFLSISERSLLLLLSN